MDRPVIAVVEDDPDTLLLLDDLLCAAGYETIRCMRGDEAYALIRTTQPHLILLDLMLERPSAGEQMLGMLQIDPRTKHIPVIICSAYLHTIGSKAQVLQEHGHLLLPKPFDPHELLTMITAQLLRRSAQSW